MSGREAADTPGREAPQTIGVEILVKSIEINRLRRSGEFKCVVNCVARTLDFVIASVLLSIRFHCVACTFVLGLNFADWTIADCVVTFLVYLCDDSVSMRVCWTFSCLSSFYLS